MLGNITSGDVNSKTITIRCHEGVSGLELGKFVAIIPIDNQFAQLAGFDELQCLKVRITDLERKLEIENSIKIPKIKL